MSRKMNKPSRTGKAFRVVALLTAIMMGVQASASGLMAAFVTVKEILQQKRYPGVYTSAPGPINFGANPSRDAVYRGGFFTEKTLRDKNRIDPPEPANLDLSADPLSFIGIGINLPALVQGGGDEVSVRRRPKGANPGRSCELL